MRLSCADSITLRLYATLSLVVSVAFFYVPTAKGLLAHRESVDARRYAAEGCAAPKLLKEVRAAEARIAAVEMRETTHARAHRGKGFEKS